jgi:hypothetical protein
VEERDALTVELSAAVGMVAETVRAAARLGIGPGKLAEVTGLSRQQVTNYTHGRTSSRKNGAQQ